MTTPQILSFSIIGVTMLFFAWGRFRYDVVSLVALMVAVALGLVPIKQAFTGLTSDVVVIIAAALVISAAIARSGVVDGLIAPALKRIGRLSLRVPFFVAATGALSLLTKNVGALTILLPSAIRAGREKDGASSAILMPMAFISLVAGLSTLVGTSTNIIVSQVREELMGKPYRMFDFAPVGLSLTLVAFLYLSVAWRILPRDRQGREALGQANAETFFSTEATIAAELPDGLKSVGDLDLPKHGVTAVGLIGADGRRVEVTDEHALEPGSVLVLEGTDAALADAFGRLPLESAQADEDVETEGKNEEVRTIEAVVQPGSDLIGGNARRARLQERYGVKLLGISRQDRTVTERLRDVTIRAGDVLLIRAGEGALPEALRSLSLLPLAEREVKLGNPRKAAATIAILIVAILLIAWGVVPVVAGFFGAALLMVVIGALPMREAYGALEPGVLVLIGALTPISEAVQRTGGTDYVAHLLAPLLQGHAPIVALGALMLAAMVIAPFLHNAPTVLVLGPIAAMVAKQIGLNPDPFLMAVATGAGCDFLTPVGHQCNTLVMGPGGYRFGDYARLGLPLSIMVIVLGVPLIAFFWPLQGG
ncbi:SLC13 family permease [Sphingomonas sp. KR1UV-12]|uniref:SLC13 family permease n=1 Tax=Sphingomonas aurea TaxID=3063994 RepID=A0ABT9EIR3_9SPHN|nr:SLC13 family permease [Sphingomonas sp. KR1UV-12]MDP1026859.1 SLC13 family permease [Sphingomonas sp. KR1UV-12]